MMKGAERFMAYIVFASAQCLADMRMDSGDTVMKKPALYTTFAAFRIAVFSGCVKWSTCTCKMDNHTLLATWQGVW